MRELIYIYIYYVYEFLGTCAARLIHIDTNRGAFPLVFRGGFLSSNHWPLTMNLAPDFALPTTEKGPNLV